jgi:hypothetical protein
VAVRSDWSGRTDSSGAARSGPGSDRDLRVWSARHLISLLVAVPVLLVANRGQWFFKDDWETITRRLGQPGGVSIWAPHNEHWTTLPILAFRVLFAGFGLRTYWPWIVLLIAVHLVVVHMAWRLCLHSGAGPGVATVVALILAVLGSGAENLLWGFQIGFDGAVAASLGMAVLLDHPQLSLRRGVAAVALAVIALMCAGVSLPLLIIPGLVCLFRHRVLRTAAIFVVPAAVYLTWYRLEGSAATVASPGSPGQYLRYVVTGLWDSVADAGGTRAAPVVAGIALVTALVLVLRRPGMLSHPAVVLQAASALAVLALFVSIGVGRASLGGTQAGSSRYVYLAAMAGAPLVAGAAGVLLRWRPRLTALPLAAVALFALLTNVLALQARADVERVREQHTKEDVTAAYLLARAGEPLLNVSADPQSGFSNAAAIVALDRRGAFGNRPGRVPSATLADERLRLQLAMHPGRVPAGTRPVGVRAAPGTTARRAGSCTVFDRVPGGREQVLVATVGGPGSATLAAGSPGAVTAEFLYSPANPLAGGILVEQVLSYPSTLTWLGRRGTVRLTFPGPGPTTVCAPGRAP